jgi:hypothetical protein
VARARSHQPEAIRTTSRIYSNSVLRQESGATNVRAHIYSARDFPKLGLPFPASIQPASKTPRARAVVKREVLDTLRCVHSKTSLSTKSFEVSNSKKAVTSYTLVRARVPRGFHARGIFLIKESLPKVVTDSDQYPTNIPFQWDTCGTCTSSLW